jgi:micrococcal nuclease
MYTYKANIVRVVDGDTVIADIDLGFNIWQKDQSIRLSGINAPELKGATLEAARQSRQFLEKLVLNKRVVIRTEKDKREKYGRWLGVIQIEEDKNLIEINRRMIAEGHAVAYKG